MGFQSVKDYNEEKFGGLFLLRNDGDYADVIFMYRSADEALVANVHYIKSPDYSGYVHCCGRGCPACAKNIRVQTKLFIPLYNLAANEIQFFDRTMRFEPQLMNDVFSKFPNPSEFVFRITRRGAANDVNTTYQITPVGKNTVKSYEEILAENNATFPEYYSTICKEVTVTELQTMLNASQPTTGYATPSMPDYQVTPRSVVNATAPAVVAPSEASIAMVDDADQDAADYSDAEIDEDNVKF